MPNSVLVISIFLASPGDVSSDREIVRRSVEKLNLTVGRANHVRLEVIGWETHAHPGIAEYPQQVIIQQVGQEFDVFIGLMGTRFGTPTQEAESGTQEEYTRSLTHFKSTGKPEIMWYFRTGHVDLESIDPFQLSKVLEFKERLSEDGVFFSEYLNDDGLSHQIEIHLAQIITKFLTQNNTAAGNLEENHQEASVALIQPPESEEIDGDLGFVDAQLEFLEESERIGHILESMTSAMNEHNAKLVSASDEIKGITPARRRSIARQKSIIDDVSDSMIDLAEFFEEKSPELSESISKMMSAAQFWMIESGFWEKSETDEREGVKSSLSALISTMSGNITHFDHEREHCRP